MPENRCGILDISIDVDVRAQICRELFLFVATPYNDSTESEVRRKLDAKMPKATNPPHSDQISATQASIADLCLSKTSTSAQDT